MAGTGKLAKLRKFFRASNKRYTVEREHMLDVIDELKGQRYSIVKLYNLARKRGMIHAASTLYRNIFMFVDAGFISEVHLTNGKTEYESNTGQNTYLLCVGCGEVKKIRPPKEFKAMQEELCCKHQMEMLSYNYQIKGYCSNCSRRTEQEPKQN
ncbi:transcriptional repressor [Lentisphaerota bacterium ZTH]|nr:transcriptional repressor [Lentisphaerota bacterium]WET06435.1 transcriptional repressor [Lentisphaerota bacterium ZTH]